MIAFLAAIAALQIAPKPISWPDRGLAAVGLETIRWGMSPAELRGQLPNLVPARSPRGGAVDLLNGNAALVNVEGCVYKYRFYGAYGRLTALESELSSHEHEAACAASLKRRLVEYLHVVPENTSEQDTLFWSNYGETVNYTWKRGPDESLGLTATSPDDRVLRVSLIDILNVWSRSVGATSE